MKVNEFNCDNNFSQFLKKRKIFSLEGRKKNFFSSTFFPQWMQSTFHCLILKLIELNYSSRQKFLVACGKLFNVENFFVAFLKSKIFLLTIFFWIFVSLCVYVRDTYEHDIFCKKMTKLWIQWKWWIVARYEDDFSLVKWFSTCQCLIFENRESLGQLPIKIPNNCYNFVESNNKIKLST